MAAVIKLPRQRSGGSTGSAVSVKDEALIGTVEDTTAEDTTAAATGASEASEAKAGDVAGPEDAFSRFRRGLAQHSRPIALTLAVYNGLHIVAGLALLWVLHARGESVDKFVHLGWDSASYLGIARDGYHDGHDYAFFPLYPMLVRVFQAATGLTFNYAGVFLATTFSSAAAVGMRYVGERLTNARTALILVALWAVVPSAIMQVWAYADGLFTALAAWALYALLRRAWLTAGILTLLAGLTRPSASALILVVCLSALFEIVRRGFRTGAAESASASDSEERGNRGSGAARWRPWVGGIIAPLGMLSWVLVVGHHFGRLTGYFTMQHDLWNNWFDGGRTTYDDFASLIDGRGDNPSVMYLVTCATMVAVPFLLVLAHRQRLPWPLIVYSAGLAVLIMGTHRQILTTPRELMPAFPLLLPVAHVLSRSRNRGLIVAMVAIAAMSGWYAWFMPLTYGAP